MASLFLYLYAVAAHWLFTFGGIAVLGFLIYEKYWRKETPSRWFWAIAIICLWIGFYQAWLDEHHNLTTVIDEKAKAVGDLGNCGADLRVAGAKAEFFQRQADIGVLNFGTQQNALNACIVAMGKANGPEPLRITTREAAFDTPGATSTTGRTQLSALVINTNKIISPVHATLICSQPFTLMGAEFAMGPHWTMSAKRAVIAENKARFEIESPAWNPGIAFVVLVASQGDLSPCDLKLD